MIIRDGSNGFTQKVNRNNRAFVTALDMTERRIAAKIGNAWIFNVSGITLTATTESSCIYVYNDEQSDLVIDKIRIGCGVSTSGTTNTLAKFYAGATAVSYSTAATAKKNSNIGSSKALSSGTLVYKGAEAATVTAGVVIDSIYIPQNSFIDLNSDIIVPRGTNFSVGLVPPASNSSMPVSVSIYVYIQDTNEM